jgi:quercetin dioxygenase-like cupin family protein
MAQPKVVEKIIGNVWFHTMTFEKAGDFKMGHKHNYDHAHMVSQGSVEAFELEYEGDEWQAAERKSIGIYRAGDVFLVPKNVSHTLVALEDNTIGSCVQAVRDDETGEIVSCFCNGEEWEAPEKITV